MDDEGRGVDSNSGNGTEFFSTAGVADDMVSSSRGSSLGVGGSELSSEEVESNESFGARDMEGAVVGLGCSLSPRDPTCCGRPEVGVEGMVV